MAQYNEDPSLKEFGIIVNTNFTKVESTVFKPPSIEYHQQVINKFNKNFCILLRVIVVKYTDYFN